MCVCVGCNKFRYIFKGVYEKEFVASAEFAVDEIDICRKGKVTSSRKAILRLLGYWMFASERRVKDAASNSCNCGYGGE